MSSAHFHSAGNTGANANQILLNYCLAWTGCLLKLKTRFKIVLMVQEAVCYLTLKYTAELLRSIFSL